MSMTERKVTITATASRVLTFQRPCDRCGITYEFEHEVTAHGSASSTRMLTAGGDNSEESQARWLRVQAAADAQNKLAEEILKEGNDADLFGVPCPHCKLIPKRIIHAVFTDSPVKEFMRLYVPDGSEVRTGLLIAMVVTVVAIPALLFGTKWLIYGGTLQSEAFKETVFTSIRFWGGAAALLGLIGLAGVWEQITNVCNAIRLSRKRRSLSQRIEAALSGMPPIEFDRLMTAICSKFGCRTRWDLASRIKSDFEGIEEIILPGTDGPSVLRPSRP
ncbi:MAG: hypothetical protein ABFD92_00235 [Planctomycetaceae bacterium]|nr:hypothetical protein [Planctomycetaceae bacterium]